MSSAGMSAINAPIADSDPARYLSLSAALLGEVICNCNLAFSPPGTSGAWCQAAMYGEGVS